MIRPQSESRPSADRSAADSLWFLAPGLLHHLGNALFTAHGRLQLMGGNAQLAEDRAAVLAGLDRAQSALAILRQMCGDPSPASVGRTLAALDELLRVPLRDRGLALSVRGPAGAGAAVDGGPFALLVLAVVRRLVALAVPGPSGGRIELVWTVDGTEVQLAFGMHPAPGQPPFALDPPTLLEAVAAELRDLGGRGGEAAPGVLALALPARGASAQR